MNLIQATIRNTKSKGQVKSLRNSGEVPGIVYGGENANEIIKTLKEFSFVIRKVLSKKIAMKFLPKIIFVKDESFDYAEKIENLIKQTQKRIE